MRCTIVMPWYSVSSSIQGDGSDNVVNESYETITRKCIKICVRKEDWIFSTQWHSWLSHHRSPSFSLLGTWHRPHQTDTFTSQSSIARFSHVSFDPHLNNPGLVDYSGISIALLYDSNDPTLVALNLDKILSNSTLFSYQQSDVPPAFPYLCKKRPPLPSASRSGDRQTPQGRDLGGDIYNVGINSLKKFESPWARPQGWPLSFSRAEDNLSMWASTGRLWMTKLT